MTTLLLKWVLPWASVFIVSSTLAYTLDHAVVAGSTSLSTPAEPQRIDWSGNAGTDPVESCLTAWSRVSHVYPDLERFAAKYCVGLPYMPVPAPSRTYDRVRALDDPFGFMP
jgi:hypothetical protein